MYLQGTAFKVVVDHKPLVLLYNREAKPKQPRVDRHLMKLANYDFELMYEAGSKNPCDYGSRHPPPLDMDNVTEREQEELGVAQDSEIYVARVVEDQLPDALTRSMVRKATREDKKLSLLREDIERGVCRPALHQYTKVFEDLTVVDGMIIREGRLLVPESLRAVTIQIAHEGHLGQQKTLGLLRLLVVSEYGRLGQGIRGDVCTVSGSTAQDSLGTDKFHRVSGHADTACRL